MDKNNSYTRNEDTNISDNITLSYCTLNVEIEKYQSLNVKLIGLCRICGEVSNNYMEIFDGNGIELRLKDKIQMHLPIIVDADDLMPQKLCIECYKKLEVTHSLIITCLKTDIKLKKLLNIEQTPDYSTRYREIIQECCLESTEEMHLEEPIQSAHRNFSQNAVHKLRSEQELHMGLGDIPNNNNTSNSLCENKSENLIHSPFNGFTDCYNKITSKRGVSIDSSIEETSAFVEHTNIACPHCKDTFRTMETFENHKILYNEECGILLHKHNGLSTDCTFPEVKHTGQMGTCDLPESLQVSEQLIIIDGNLDCERNLLDSKSCTQIELRRKCGHCDAIFSTKKELLNHIVECHGGRVLYKCFTCEKTYEKWSGLDVHEATHRLDKPYLCDLCGKSFKHSNNLRGHKRTHLDDSKKKRHICEICGNAFRSRFHLREHTNQHDGTKPYSCEECGKTFHKRIQLRQHKFSHGSHKYVCPVCSASFNRRGNMTAHLKRHNDGYGTYTCSVCTFKFATMSELKLHRKEHTKQDIMESMKRKCSGKPVWECKICNRLFPKRAVLLYHERSHANSRVSVDCDQCGKKLSSRKSLSYHKKSIHSSERQHICHYCGEAFVSRESRLIHERIHTGERPYVCKVCNMRYKCSSNLNQHAKIHSGARPHKCSYCGKGFARKDTLGVHERIHTGVKPFACLTCGRSFAQKNDMLKHTRTHDAKPLRCEKCDQIFKKKKDIQKHVALHEHDEAPVMQCSSSSVLQSHDVILSCSPTE